MFEVLATGTFRSLDPATCVHPSGLQGPSAVMCHSSHSHSVVRSTVTFYHASRAAEGYSPDVPLFWLMFITSLLASHCHQGYCYLNQKLNIWNENWVVLVMSHITVSVWLLSFSSRLYHLHYFVVPASWGLIPVVSIDLEALWILKALL